MDAAMKREKIGTSAYDRHNLNVEKVAVDKQILIRERWLPDDV